MSHIKRIINKDLKMVRDLKLEDQGIYLHYDDNNILNMTAYIFAPNDSIYSYGILTFEIIFPNDYPFSPPKLKYISRSNIRIHPNFYVNGKVCLSILGTWQGPTWKPVMDISSILLSIQSLLDNNPLCNEPGYNTITNTHKIYNIAIRYEVLKTLLFINNFKNIPESILNKIKKYLLDNKDNIIKEINILNNNKNNKKYNINIYRINIDINYNNLKEELSNQYLNLI